MILILGAAACLIGTERLGLSLAVRFDFWRAGLRMFAQHPFEGVGLAGYAEHYPFFKMASGWETKDAHNEYVHMLAEFGVLGPLVYLALWWTVLKNGFRVSGFGLRDSAGAIPPPPRVRGRADVSRSERGEKGVPVARKFLRSLVEPFALVFALLML